MSTPIDQKHAELVRAGFDFGSPQGGEGICADGAGRYRHFEHGSIFWTPDHGAHLVYGLIRAKWSALGYERSLLSYPLTDECGTPDGVGRYNHFERGSIYWTPSTGAWEVHGQIRDKWASLGWERSALGYPVSDEKDTPDHAGRVSEFQGGAIYWTAQQGAWVVQRGGGGAAGSISGKAFGPGMGTVKVFRVALCGPDDRSHLRESKPFGAAGEYSFGNLPAGRYWVSVDTKADIMVAAHPRTREVTCTGGPLTNIDFEIR